MNIRKICLLLTGFLLALPVSILRAAPEPGPVPAAAPPAAPAFPLAAVLGLANGLEINPKVIGPTDGKDTTVGLQYKYDRGLTNYPLHKETTLEIRLKSEGLIVADEKKSPNRLLTHGVRLSAIDLVPSKRTPDEAMFVQVSNRLAHVEKDFFQPWAKLVERIKALKKQPALNTDETAELVDKSVAAARYLDQARPLLAEYGTVEVDDVANQWLLAGAAGEKLTFQEVLQRRVITPRWVFLSFDLDANAETDQTFTDVQLVGSAQFSGKLHWRVFDLPFELLRGGAPQDDLNRDGGPFFYAGLAAVDASGNDSRKAITTDNQHFARAQFGVSYRTEVFSISAKKSVALELAWRYYHEFDAPKPLRSKHLDSTSYFQATLLFPGNYFLQYTDGKLPLDVEGSSTVCVGWRHNF